MLSLHAIDDRVAWGIGIISKVEDQIGNMPNEADWAQDKWHNDLYLKSLMKHI